MIAAYAAAQPDGTHEMHVAGVVNDISKEGSFVEKGKRINLLET